MLHQRILIFKLCCLLLLAGSFKLSAQEIRGAVRDAGTMEAIPGVNIHIKGSTQGTITDINGTFTIEVEDEEAILVFTYVGYHSQEIKVGGKRTIDVSLLEDATELDEVVVVGYGTKSKREVTGAMSSINAEDFSKQIVLGVDQAMVGRAPGVQVVQNSATPGGGTSVRIRGVGTPGVNEPLYVVDGVPMFPDDNKRTAGGSSQNVLNMINPSDIASIEILRDAASSAIYGARAANGVVLITTKTGEVGAPRISLDYSYGLQQFENRIELLNAEEYKAFRDEKRYDYVDSDYDTDWMDEITRQAAIQNVNLSVSGGSEKTTYYTSLGYTNQEGIVKGTDYERITGRLNITNKVSKMFRVGANLSFAYSDQHRKPENSIYSSAVGAALLHPPIVPAREPTGEYGSMAEYATRGGFERVNPLALVEVGYDRVKNFKMLGNIFAEFEPVKNLVYRVNAGLDYQNTTTDTYMPGIFVGVTNRQVSDIYITRYDANEVVWLLENTLSYRFSIQDKHNFTLLAGATQQASRFESLYGSATGAVAKNPNLTSLSSSPAVARTAGGQFWEWSLASFLGRFDYNYKNRYMLSASIRQDGSSRFKSGNQWGTFPSVSAGWNVDDEAFFNVGFISDMKIRASWGKLGNQEIAQFQYLSTLGNTEYIYNNTPVAGVYPNSVANESITWESSVQKDIGLDMAFFRNRLSFYMDYFDKETDGILLPDNISSLYGYTDNQGTPIDPISNSGVISNRGFEFALGYKDSRGDFSWSLQLNATTLKNEVLSLGGGDPIITTLNSGLYSTKTDVGTQVGSFFGKVYEGIGENGRMIFAQEEVDGNMVDVQTTIGNPIPSLTYGLNFDASYKGFDFAMTLYGVQGNDIYAATLYQIGNFTYALNNQSKYIMDQAGISAPTVKAALSSDYAASSWFVWDGSFARLKSLQLGYNLSPRALSKMRLRGLRIYISAQNLFTIDSYVVGMNPEVGAFNQNNTAAGIDEGTYPVARVFSTGININF